MGVNSGRMNALLEKIKRRRVQAKTKTVYRNHVVAQQSNDSIQPGSHGERGGGKGVRGGEGPEAEYRFRAVAHKRDEDVAAAPAQQALPQIPEIREPHVPRA